MARLDASRRLLGGPCPHPRLGLLGRPTHRCRRPLRPPSRGTDGLPGVRAMTVPVLEGFETAVGRGTRTRTGVPGPRYWQQWADYKLSAELNPVSKRMTGSGTITYSNRSPDTLRTVYVQLLQNIFAPNARHNTGVPWSVEGDRARPGGRAGHHARRGRRRGPGLRGERHDHAASAAEAARCRGARPSWRSTGSCACRPTARRAAARTARSTT